MKKPRTLLKDQCTTLLNAFFTKGSTGRASMLERRNYTMALTLLDTGVRVGELVQLLQGDIYYAGVCVEVLTVRAELAKGHKEREIPLSPRLRAAFMVLHDRVWPQTTDQLSHYAFYTSNPHEPLTPRQVQRIISATALDVLGVKVTPHSLRHTFASNVLRKSNLRVTQELLGHASVQTTQIYTHPNSDDKKRAIDQLGCEVSPQT